MDRSKVDRPSICGFSLIELSIVLVILGLLVGGILSGQALVRAAELRSVSAEYQRWTAATNAFRDKYFQLPGDMQNATQFWGKSATYCNGHTGVAATPGTCNGDGNGILSAAGSVNGTGEIFRYWQQLALAGLIEGQYDGIAGSLWQAEATATNSARSKLNRGFWYAFNWNTTYSGSSAFDGPYYDNMYQYGGLNSGGTNAVTLLRPEELWNIDTKIDDGRPAYGIVRERLWGGCNDATSSANLNCNYRLNNSGQICLPLFTLK